MFPMILICIIASVYLLLSYPLNMVFLAYLVCIYLDDAPFSGNRTSTWFRSL